MAFKWFFNRTNGEWINRSNANEEKLQVFPKNLRRKQIEQHFDNFRLDS